MGRHVYDLSTGEHVWKYWFAIQNSNQSDIALCLGIGEAVGVIYSPDVLRVWHVLSGVNPEDDEWISTETDISNNQCSYDRLTLVRSDIPKLKQWLEKNEHQSDRHHPLGGRTSLGFDEIDVHRDTLEIVAFYEMVKAYTEHMEAYPDIETFVFEGEY